MSKETEWWDSWNLSCRTGEIDWKTSQVQAVILRTLQNLQLPEGQRVLEVGSGTGWLGASLPKSWDYLGLDLSPAAVAMARKRAPHRNFESGDLMEMNIPAASFDIFVCVDTIPHFADQDQAMLKISTALKVGGWALVSTVNPLVYSRISWVAPVAEGQIRKWLSKSELHSLLRRCSLHPVRSWTILPEGDLGFLKFLNLPALNKMPGGRLFGAAKAAVGLGQFRVVLARKTT